jgi:nucleotide-binding universal stress UspA family protein
MKTILVGTDFNEGSIKALEKARELAKQFDSKIYLLHVLEPVDDPDSDDPETEEFYSKLKMSSLQKLDAAKANLSPLETDCSVRVGRRHPTLLQVANDVDADLIVLGSNPISEESQRIGTSHRVAVTSARPVLLVP